MYTFNNDLDDEDIIAKTCCTKKYQILGHKKVFADINKFKNYLF